MEWQCHEVLQNSSQKLSSVRMPPRSQTSSHGWRTSPWRSIWKSRDKRRNMAKHGETATNSSNFFNVWIFNTLQLVTATKLGTGWQFVTLEPLCGIVLKSATSLTSLTFACPLRPICPLFWAVHAVLAKDKSGIETQSCRYLEMSGPISRFYLICICCLLHLIVSWSNSAAKGKPGNLPCANYIRLSDYSDEIDQCAGKMWLECTFVIFRMPLAAILLHSVFALGSEDLWRFVKLWSFWVSLTRLQHFSIRFSGAVDAKSGKAWTNLTAGSWHFGCTLDTKWQSRYHVIGCSTARIVHMPATKWCTNKAMLQTFFNLLPCAQMLLNSGCQTNLDKSKPVTKPATRCSSCRIRWVTRCPPSFVLARTASLGKRRARSGWESGSGGAARSTASPKAKGSTVCTDRWRER